MKSFEFLASQSIAEEKFKAFLGSFLNFSEISLILKSPFSNKRFKRRQSKIHPLKVFWKVSNKSSI
jgi:hypothetical protein